MMRSAGLLPLLVLACSGEPPVAEPSTQAPPRSEVAAEVGETQILVRDVMERMRRDGLGARDATSRLVDEELAVQEARRRGILGHGELAWAREQAQVQKLLEVEVESAVREEDVSPAQIAGEYRKAEALTADHVLVRLDEGATDSQVSRARELASKIQHAALEVADEAAFAALAARFSTPELAATHEELGEFVRDGTYVDELVDEALKLHRPGEISNAFRTSFGWHVVRLRSRRNLFGPSAEEARPRIVQAIVIRLRRARFEELVARLTKRARISVDGDVLSRIAEP
ncbi:MAG: peptidylprolyl isomerase [Deltaproteobacteria bacterium]|nr:peptidylprolyl isomerase [Deltaproteobacteria bacterium]